MENMTRRDFGKLALGASAGLMTITVTGCNWVKDVEEWAVDGQASIASLVATLQANGVTVPSGQGTPLFDLNAALTSVEQAASTYLSTSPAPQGALQKIEDALADCSTAVSNFLTALGLPGGGLLALVTTLGEFLLSTIAGFVNKASAASGTSVAATSFRVGAQSYTVTPVYRSPRAYKSGWNGVLDKSSGVTIPKGAKFRLSVRERLHLTRE